jgi:ribosomal protein S18 acetylase RimI-like enzyme
MTRQEHPVVELSSTDAKLLESRLVLFNDAAVPFTQREPFLRVQYGIRDPNGTLIAGVALTQYCWNIVYIDVLWVEEGHRRQGLGTKLIRFLEVRAKEAGSTLIHLDTFDFQGKAFYERLGYRVFGVLDECPPGHQRYFLKKSLNAA